MRIIIIIIIIINNNNNDDVKQEWVWPFGYYLKAVMNFNNDKEDLKFRILNKLANHEKEIKSSIWGGLTELTNKDGEYCAASCPTQAWSSSTILDALHSLFTSLS